MNNVSVVIPALNEEATVGTVVRTVARSGPSEIIVIDADSTDNTAARARGAGATVYNWRDILPDIAPIKGKGESLWRGVHAAKGEIVVFIDADLESLDEHTVPALVAPFADPAIQLVKANYARTINGQPTGGGRVTELTAKPLLDVYFPELSHIHQPLSGEYALRRDVAQEVPFVHGYGVDVGLLIDVAREHGFDAVAQVQLPDRVHRNRPLHELASMAQVVARTILQRAGAAQLEANERRPLRSL